MTTLASAITGSGSLTLQSASAASQGTFAITGQNSTGTSNSTYTGLTTITGQTSVALLGNTALGSTAATAGTVLSGGSTLILSGGITIGTELLTVTGASLGGGDAIRNLAGTSTWQGAITLLPSPSGDINSTFDVAQGQLTLSGAISGVNDLNKTGNGNLTLSGNNTFTGQTNIEQGDLSIGSAQALGSLLGGTTVSSGAVLTIAAAATINPELLTLNGGGNPSGTGATATTGALFAASKATWTGNIILGAGTAIGGTTGLTITGNVSGADLTELGSVALTLMANSTFAGSLTLSSGTLTLSNASANLGATTIGTGDDPDTQQCRHSARYIIDHRAGRDPHARREHQRFQPGRSSLGHCAD